MSPTEALRCKNFYESTFIFCSVSHLKGLHVAAKSGVTDNCRYLIEEAGIHGNILDDQNQTALFYSTESQALECSEYLLSVGCSANHKNTDGRRYACNTTYRTIDNDMIKCS